MQSRSRVLEDLARVTAGAASTLAGIKNEIEALARQRIERLLADMDLVPRDEFDAVKAMAAKARTEQERLEKRLAALEARLEIKAPEKRGPKTAAAPKAGQRKAPARKR